MVLDLKRSYRSNTDLLQLRLPLETGTRLHFVTLAYRTIISMIITQYQLKKLSSQILVNKHMTSYNTLHLSLVGLH